MKKIKAIRGMRDIIYPESSKWDIITSRAQDILRLAGFRSIYLPAAEYTSLFSRTIGEDTDIVKKEMYSFKDKKGRDLTLRPEGTAGAVRAMIENRLLEGRVREKVMYTGAMFRYEKPQSGRYRQFYQLGCEIFGSSSVYADAEITCLAAEILDAVLVRDYVFRVNSIGCEECRKNYVKELRKFLSSRLSRLCEDCVRRFDTNILRVLDCKNSSCRKEQDEIPPMSQFLCVECTDFFARFLDITESGNINIVKDARLVRGLDYYTGVVFEVECGGDIILAGGRYDNLVSELGGGSVPACGWALGLDRVSEKSRITVDGIPLFYIALIDGGEEKEARKIAGALRSEGIPVEVDFEKAPAGKKFKMADRRGVSAVGIIGGKEIETSSVSVKNMRTGNQESFGLEDIEGIIKYIKC